MWKLVVCVNLTRFKFFLSLKYGQPIQKSTRVWKLVVCVNLTRFRFLSLKYGQPIQKSTEHPCMETCGMCQSDTFQILLVPEVRTTYIIAVLVTCSDVLFLTIQHIQINQLCYVVSILKQLSLNRTTFASQIAWILERLTTAGTQIRYLGGSLRRYLSRCYAVRVP